MLDDLSGSTAQHDLRRPAEHELAEAAEAASSLQTLKVMHRYVMSDTDFTL